MVVVTMTGEPFKRYVVDTEDEYMFVDWPGRENTANFIFGGQALRARGVIDEQYRSLDAMNVTKVAHK